MVSTLYRADILSSLLNGLKNHPVYHANITSIEYSFFCPNEKEVRRITLLYKGMWDSDARDSDNKQKYNYFFSAICMNCHHTVFISVFYVDGGPRLVIVDRDHSNSMNSNVPESVRYYLNQADKSYGVGANSAAVAMYRAALEQFLYSAGFEDGMLHNKITRFERAANESTSPKWMRDLDRDYLDIIKELGNSSIHPNRGDISAQDKFNEELLSNIQIVFSELIYKRFEEPSRELERKSLLKQGITKKTAS